MSKNLEEGSLGEGSPARSKGKAAMYLLEVLNGPLDGKTWSFDAEITIGRDDAVAQACIALDRYVSRKHAQLRADGERLYLIDLGSRNGTKLDGKDVAERGELVVGAPFVVGRTMLRVTRA